MIDCDNTKNFFKEFRRMCDSQDLCKLCPISEANGRATKAISISPCNFFVRDNLKKAIEIVQQWSNEHSAKTLLDDLKEKYPNYQKSFKDGTPSICPYKLGYEDSGNCPADTCKECWNRPLDEVIKK